MMIMCTTNTTMFSIFSSIQDLQENAAQVIQQLGCADYAEYKVIPYMCMNKVLISRYKKIAFPIVSYPELEEIISGLIRE